MPKLHLLHQSLQQGLLLPWGIAGGAPVELHQVNGAAQPLTGGRRRFAKAVAAQPPWVGGQLGGHAHPLALLGPEAGQSPAQKDFAAPLKLARAVGVGGVEEGEPRLDARLKRLQQQGVVPFGTVFPEQAVPPGPGAHPDGRPVRCARALPLRGHLDFPLTPKAGQSTPAWDRNTRGCQPSPPLWGKPKGLTYNSAKLPSIKHEEMLTNTKAA